MNVIATFEHVRSMKTRELVKEYGKAASVVLRLCSKANIYRSNRIIIADSWFANLSLFRGLRKNGLHLIGMIKQGDGAYSKIGLCRMLENKRIVIGYTLTRFVKVCRSMGHTVCRLPINLIISKHE